MKVVDKRVKFDELYISHEEGVITGFFTIEKPLLEEMYPNQYPEAIAGKLSVEISTDLSMKPVEEDNAVCSISPVEYNINNKEYDCYNWFDVCLPQDEVKELVNIMKEELK